MIGIREVDDAQGPEVQDTDANRSMFLGQLQGYHQWLQTSVGTMNGDSWVHHGGWNQQGG